MSLADWNALKFEVDGRTLRNLDRKNFASLIKRVLGRKSFGLDFREI